MINLREIFKGLDSFQYFRDAVGQKNMDRLNNFSFDMLTMLYCAELALQALLDKEGSDGSIDEESAELVLEHITRLINRVERTMEPRQNE